MGINDKMQREQFALTKYCKIHNLDEAAFVHADKPDLQSVKLGIGIEETSGLLPGEHTIWGEATNQKKNREKLDEQEKKIEALENEFNAAAAPNQWERIGKSLDKAIKKRKEMLDKLVFACSTSTITASQRILGIVQEKTSKLNEGYTCFQTNALFINFPSRLAGTNCFSLCGIDRCDVESCEKCDNCSNCMKSDKENGCFEDDCQTYRICKIGAFVRALRNTSFDGHYKFNPIILSQLGEDSISYDCWVINTDNYSVVEYAHC